MLLLLLLAEVLYAIRGLIKLEFKNGNWFVLPLAFAVLFFYSLIKRLGLIPAARILATVLFCTMIVGVYPSLCKIVTLKPYQRPMENREGSCGTLVADFVLAKVAPYLEDIPQNLIYSWQDVCRAQNIFEWLNDKENLAAKSTTLEKFTEIERRLAISPMTAFGHQVFLGGVVTSYVASAAKRALAWTGDKEPVAASVIEDLIDIQLMEYKTIGEQIKFFSFRGPNPKAPLPFSGNELVSLKDVVSGQITKAISAAHEKVAAITSPEKQTVVADRLAQLEKKKQDLDKP